MVNFTPAVVGRLNKSEINSKESIRDHMSKAFITLSKDITISEASTSLLKMNLTGAPVVGDKGELIGFLSEKDCLKFSLDSKYYNHTPSSVEHFMSRTVMTISPSDTLLHVVELFLKNNFQIYPVVEEQRVVGVVSRKMILEAVTKMKQTSW
ncbi:CBS domain-containing protein [Halobacteriovorax sp. HLS]|uniref:CBS domain-containing protein n=1 Tax=Halobacteriovorax sp. HLS TaxID=2234000 RepID=UPI0013E3C2A3|nr:CBS domain-containing protein [Halobacteriovorax sp. HLS]